MTERRALTAEDLGAALDLWQVAFGHNDPASRPGRRDWFLRHPEWVRGAFVQGRLASVLRLYPFMVTWSGGEVPMGGVASVATAVEHRSQGLARVLLLDALDELADRGVGWCGLWPFQGAFYRRLGWSRCHRDERWEADLRSLPRVSGRVEALSEPPVQDLDRIHRAWARHWNLGLLRSPEWWERRLGNFGRPALLFGARDEEGDLQAYLHLELQSAEPGAQVLDLAWTSAPAGRALLAALGGLSAQASRWSWKAPAGQALLGDDELERHPTLDLRPGVMLRVCDVAAALRALPAPPGAGRLLLEVHDDLLPRNRGTFRVEWGPAGVEVRRSRRSASALRLDVRDLGPLLSGFTSSRTALSDGRAEGPEGSVRALAAFAGGRGTHCADFF